MGPSHSLLQSAFAARGFGATSRLRSPPFEKRAQLAAPRRMTQLAKRLRLDLPDPFARHREALTDFFERVLAAVADAEPHLDDFFFARRQRFQHRLGLLLQVQVDHRLGRRYHLTVL